MNDQHVTLFHIVTLTDVSVQILHMIVKVKLSFFSMIGCGRSPFKPWERQYPEPIETDRRQVTQGTMLSS